MPENSQLAGRTVAEVFDRYPELLLVAIIRKQQIQLPRGPSRMETGDQLLIASSEASLWRALIVVVCNRERRWDANALNDARPFTCCMR